ncbi:TPA: hypothetical protein N0F65_009836 [Lagenidium giganteum]|uniref:BZIP domain-containing protein n=1 Tax=Lagenidium giganteum TaxID=4803 RepID=A0AAV2YV95_9STRA|nr:TPA: hypothetical protein N0F65_009836 [Lagenidium giganteum]
MPTEHANVAAYRALWRRQNAASATVAAAPSPARRMTDEERAEKHRMIVRRAYYQKKEVKAGLREEIEQLEAQYRDLVTQNQQLQLRNTAEAATVGEQDVHTRYRELTIVKEALLTERKSLEARLLEQFTFQDKLDGFYQQVLREPTPPQRALPSLPSNYITVETLEFPVTFRPLSETECLDIIRESRRDIISQNDSTAFFAVGPPVMDWSRKRTYGSRANFSLLKRFSTPCAEQIWAKTWRLYTETRLFEELYSESVNMKFQILQRVNDSNVLFCRTLKTEKLSMRNATFFLLSKFQVEDKLFILFRSIGEERVLADLPRDAVLGMFSWLSFSMGSDSVCEVEFGGIVPSTSVADTDFWMLEFLSYLMRLENRAVGPIFRVLQE